MSTGIKLGTAGGLNPAYDPFLKKVFKLNFTI